MAQLSTTISHAQSATAFHFLISNLFFSQVAGASTSMDAILENFQIIFLNFLNFSKLFQNIFIVDFKIDFFAVLSATQLHFSFVLIDISIRVLTIVLVTGHSSMFILKVRHKGGHFLSYGVRIYQTMMSLSYYRVVERKRYI